MASIVTIEEAACIGCTKCLQVCPVDAIVGASQQIHVVLTEYCIGCQLCLPPCPVNCIEVQEIALSPPLRKERAKVAKSRYQARKLRLIKIAQQKKAADLNVTSHAEEIIAASLARAKQKRQVLNAPKSAK